MRVLSLHMNIGIVKRSTGRSAVKAAAYMAGESLRDDRTGLVYDYSGRDGVERTGIALSDQAPDWALDRNRLWNEAEARETRSNSRTARRFIVNMPHEFDERLRIEANLKIAQLLADRYGAADYAAHAPDKHGDHRNFHSHYLIPTRTFTDGAWSKNKDRVLDDRKTGPEEIRRLRREMSDVINDIAVREKLPIFVEYLSFKDRGIEQEPQKHMGPIASQKERLGQMTDIGDKNRATIARNEQRRQLRAEQNVIDIELAREELRRKHGAAAGLPARKHWTPDEKQTAFYRELWEGRAAMVAAFERDHGQEEKQLKQTAAQLQQSIAQARGLTGLWRKMTGRAKAEKERMAEAKEKLQAIARTREEQRAAFEHDRLQRLEALKAEQARRAEERTQMLARAVGEPAALRKAEPAQPLAPAPRTPDEDRQARRREFFRRQGVRARAEREAKRPYPAPEPEKTASPAETAPAAPANDFKQAAGPKDVSVSDREARRREYFRRINRQREQSPDHDQGPKPDF